MNFIKKLSIGILIISAILLISFCFLFIKIRPFSICVELSNCEITEFNYLNWLPDVRFMSLLDSLTLYEHKNIDNGYDDYFYYANGHTYCIKDSSLISIKESVMWDEKIDKNLIYFYTPIMDDSYLIRIRKILGCFFVVEVFEDFSDATFEAVVNRGCRLLSPLPLPLSAMKKGD